MASSLSIALSLIGGILPALGWLIFWLREDKRRPEPRSLIAEVFLAGAVAVLPAYLLQQFLGQVWPAISSGRAASTVIIWAGIEELVKYLAVVIVAFSSRYFDEPIDAMIYLITAALGFAAAENSLFMWNVLARGGDQVDLWLNGNFRFIGATIAHLVSSAMLGSFIALGLCRHATQRLWLLIAGLCTATALHAAFNYLIIQNENSDILKIFILFWALAIVIIYLFERVKMLACHLET